MSQRGGTSPAAAVPVFPFLAVLLCTMGAMVTLLYAFSRQAESRLAEATEVRAQPDDGIEEEKAALEWRISMLQESRGKTEANLNDERHGLSHLEDHIRRLRQRGAQLAQAAAEMDRASPNDPQKTAGELARLRARFRDEQRELDETKKKVAAQPVSYSVVPYEGPNQTHRRPVYIECVKDGVILQPEGIVFNESDFDGPMGPGNPLASAMRAAREYITSLPSDDIEGTEPYPLLLVRPDAIDAYMAARAALATWGSQFGYELIAADWKVKYPPADPKLAEILRDVIAEARLRQRAMIAAAPQRYRSQGRQTFHVKSKGGVEAERSRGSGGGPRGVASGRGRGGGGFGTGGGRGNGQGPGQGDAMGEGAGGDAMNAGGSGLGPGGSNPYAGLGRGAGGGNGLGGNGLGGNGLAGTGQGGNSLSGNSALGSGAGGTGTMAGGGGYGAAGGTGSGQYGSGSGSASGFGSQAGGNGASGQGQGTGQGGGAAGSSQLTGQPGGAGDGSSASGDGTGGDQQLGSSGSGTSDLYGTASGGTGSGATNYGSPGGGAGGAGQGSQNGTQGQLASSGDPNRTTGAAGGGQSGSGQGGSGSGQAGGAAGGGTGSGGAAGQNGNGNSQAGGARGSGKASRPGGGGSSGSASGQASSSGDSSGASGGTGGDSNTNAPIGMPNVRFGNSATARAQAQNNNNNSSSSGGQGGSSSHKGESLAKSRGRDWGLPESGGNAVAVTRPVVVECRRDRLTLLGDDGQSVSQEIKLSAETRDSVDELVAAMMQHMQGWGLAGKGLYWKPTLIMRVAPDARDRFSELQTLLADSGYELRESTKGLAEAPKNTKPTKPSRRR